MENKDHPNHHLQDAAAERRRCQATTTPSDASPQLRRTACAVTSTRSRHARGSRQGFYQVRSAPRRLSAPRLIRTTHRISDGPLLFSLSPPAPRRTAPPEPTTSPRRALHRRLGTRRRRRSNAVRGSRLAALGLLLQEAVRKQGCPPGRPTGHPRRHLVGRQQCLRPPTNKMACLPQGLLAVNEAVLHFRHVLEAQHCTI